MVVADGLAPICCQDISNHHDDIDHLMHIKSVRTWSVTECRQLSSAILMFTFQSCVCFLPTEVGLCWLSSYSRLLFVCLWGHLCLCIQTICRNMMKCATSYEISVISRDNVHKLHLFLFKFSLLGDNIGTKPEQIWVLKNRCSWHVKSQI